MTHQNYQNISYMPENDNMMHMEPNTAENSLVEETKKHRAMYPEIHYKLKPFITVTCDAIQTAGMMPTKEEFDNITDNIHDEFLKMHPDMANYMKSNEDDDAPDSVAAISFGGGFRPRFGGFRRRGIGRDLIGLLLLSELAERGRGWGSWGPWY